MTNKIALWLGGLLILAIGLDILMFGFDHLIFLAKKGLELIHWLAFWR